MKIDFWELLAIFGQLLAYTLAIILIIQILRAIFGGTWQIEEIILALVIFNLTILFVLGEYVISLNNKILNVNTKIEKHVSWHKGNDKHL